MTVREMKDDAVRRISLLGENDAKTIQSLWLHISTVLPSQEETKTEKRAKAKELAHSFLGAFAASRKNEDWKKTKEDYLVDKYAEK